MDLRKFNIKSAYASTVVPEGMNLDAVDLASQTFSDCVPIIGEKSKLL